MSAVKMAPTSLDLFVCDDPAHHRHQPTLVTTGNVGYETSIAISTDGNPIVITATTPTAIWSCTCTTTQPAPPAPTNARRRRRRLLHLGYNRQTATIVSHYDNTNNDLELYVCDNPTCTTGTNQTLEDRRRRLLLVDCDQQTATQSSPPGAPTSI